MTETQRADARHTREAEPSPTTRTAGMVVVITAALAVLSIAFALPAVRSQPHNVPIGAAGPQAAGAQAAAIFDRMERAHPGAFEITYFPGEAALAHAIRNRGVYGGIALPSHPGEPATLMIATGASPAIATLLTQLGQQLTSSTGIPLNVQDLAPPALRDQRGAGLAASALPLTLAGLLPAFAFILVIPRRHGLQFGAALSSAVLSGITLTILLRYVFSSITTNFWGVAGTLSLGVAAALLFLLGMGALFGKVGLAVAAVLALLVGNPLSGLTSAPELLPAGWGTLGQLLPQGATATALRSAAFFGGAGATTAIVVLTCWAAAGAALLAVAAVRRRTLAA